MGFDKALIIYEGQTLVRNLVEVVRPLAGEVLISANESANYRSLNLPIVRDIYRGQGPLAGLHAAMLNSKKIRFLLLACDMPNVNGRLVRALLESRGDCDVVVPRTSDGGIHPLCGIYQRACFDTLEQSLALGRTRVSDFLGSPALRVRCFDTAAKGFPDLELLNLNDKKDLSCLSSAPQSGRPTPAG